MLRIITTLLGAAILAANVNASTWYVATNSTTDGPGTTWDTAFHAIQDAVDASAAGDTVLVTNGTYTTALELTVTNAITLASVNGPEVTIIDGMGAHRCVNLFTNACVLSGFTVTQGSLTNAGCGAGIYCGDSITDPRCYYAVITNCVITGNTTHHSSGGNMGGGSSCGTYYNCTFSNNIADQGGASLGGILHNCLVSGNLATYYVGGCYAGALFNCLVTNNMATNGSGFGGGCCDVDLVNCIIVGNSANQYGGGCCNCTLNNCIVESNSLIHGIFSESYSIGGGCYDCAATNCIILGNSAPSARGGGFGGSGVTKAIAVNCLITGNSATNYGGGGYGGTYCNCTISNNLAFHGGGLSDSSSFNTTRLLVQNCLITGNAADQGGGCFRGTLDNCTIAGNWATNSAGGCSSNTLINCIVWGNTAPTNANYDSVTATYSCSTPLPSGTGNLDSDPLYVDAAAGDYRLQVGSPCTDAGITLAGITDDLNGVPRPLDGDANGTSVPDMGVYELANPASDTDGDSLNDWAEVYSYGSSPTYNDSAALAVGRTQGVASVTNAPSAYGLYTASSITDLSLGCLMIQASNGAMNLSLQLEQCTNLTSGAWTNVGDAVHWQTAAPDGKDFFRVRAQ